MSYADMLSPVLAGQHLDAEQATRLMEYLIGGQASDAQIGAVLGAYRVMPANATELAAFAMVLRSHANSAEHGFEDLVDTCGTGGGAPSFNMSTSAAFVAAAAGVRIAKHGNRGVTSRCGSADVLEALGAKIQVSWDSLTRVVESVGIGFMFAPSHHPVMRHVGKARQELGFRTVFNQLGPLANPMRAQYQLVGVWHADLARPMAEALGLMGTRRALVAHGVDGLDEISPVTATRYALLWDGALTDGILTPTSFGAEPIDPEYLKPADTVEKNAELLLEAISEASSPRCEAILPSAACSIWIVGIEKTPKAALQVAREVVASGAARKKLDQFVAETQRA